MQPSIAIVGQEEWMDQEECMDQERILDIYDHNLALYNISTEKQYSSLLYKSG